MGKKQHQKDKMYLTPLEWKRDYGGKKEDTRKDATFKRLPFDHCAFSFQPFEHPYCTPEGVVFDLLLIMPFLKKHGINPVTGKKMSAKDLTKLNFSKNANEKFHCPVTFKVFNENTHIVAVKLTGNVYSMEAVDRLNVRPRFWRDLLTDEPFRSTDIITLQDPQNLDKFNITTFYHVINDLKLKKDKTDASQLKTVNSETREILSELQRDYKAPAKTSASTAPKILVDKFNAAHYSTGTAAASFTSTAFERSNEVVPAILDEELLRYERVKKKAYLTLITTHGSLNIELFCEQVPKTCENFLKHCENRYYDDTIFHRSIRNFMIQGGDPTGTGRGGDSIWGKPFKDEFKSNLTHTGRGMLSMANTGYPLVLVLWMSKESSNVLSTVLAHGHMLFFALYLRFHIGPHTNKSQFFITYRSCEHLNNKHTVFGKVVGGLPTLHKMEQVEVDPYDDKPVKMIKILTTQIFVNPFEEADEQLKREREAEVSREQSAAAEKERVASYLKPKAKQGLKAYRKGIGKYISPDEAATPPTDSISNAPPQLAITGPPEAKKKKTTRTGFADFSGW